MFDEIHEGDTCGDLGCHLIPKEHKNTMIFLHGLGDEGASYVMFAERFAQIAPETFKYTKFIFPTAHTIPVTLFSNMPMTAWADVVSLNTPQCNYEGSCPRIEKIIESEIAKGIPPHCIFLGGFSQGGAVAYMTLFRLKAPIGGLVALSTWCPIDLNNEHSNLNLLKSPDITQTPVFHGHGFADEVVNIKYGVMSVEFLKTLGFNVKYLSYCDLSHSTSDEELRDIVAFLKPLIVS